MKQKVNTKRITYVGLLGALAFLLMSIFFGTADSRGPISPL